MAFTETLTQALSLQDVLNTATVTNATAYSGLTGGGVDMLKFKRAFFIVQPGAITGGLTAWLVGCATANIAATNTNITGTSSTLSTTSNGVITLEVRSDQVTNLNSTYRYVRLALNTTNATTVAALGFGGEAIQKPGGPNYNLNTTFLPQQLVCNI